MHCCNIYQYDKFNLYILSVIILVNLLCDFCIGIIIIAHSHGSY